MSLKRLLSALLCAVVLLCSACDDAPQAATPSPTPLQSSPPIVTQTGASKYNAFALAYSSTAPLNPLTGTNLLNRELAPLIYQGLFELDGNVAAKPLLCRDFSHDDLTWTFNLKRDAVFSDGTPLTAADVVYSLTTARAADMYKSRFADVVSITADGDYTVVLTTSRLLGHLEMLLDVPIVKQLTAEDKNPPGSGNYVFIEAGDESYLRLTDTRIIGATRTRIQLVDLPEVELLVSGFEVGTISAVSADATATDPIVYGGNYEEWQYNTSNLLFLGFNGDIFAAANMRRIVSSAIDRSAICKTDFVDRATPMVFDPSAQLVGGARAELLEEQGYSDTDGDGVLDYAAGKMRFPLQPKLLVCSDNTFKVAAAHRIAQNLQRDGIAVTVSAVGWDAYNTALKNGAYDIYLGEVKLPPDLSLEELVSSGGALNLSGYTSDEVDTLLANFAAATSDELSDARQALYELLEREAPIAPLLFKTRSLLARRGVAGMPSPSQSNVYRNVDKW